MLLFLKLLPEENDTDKEQVHCATYSAVLLNGMPCLLHFPAPVYIIKN